MPACVCRRTGESHGLRNAASTASTSHLPWHSVFAVAAARLALPPGSHTCFPFLLRGISAGSPLPLARSLAQSPSSLPRSPLLGTLHPLTVFFSCLLQSPPWLDGELHDSPGPLVPHPRCLGGRPAPGTHRASVCWVGGRGCRARTTLRPLPALAWAVQQSLCSL